MTQPPARTLRTIAHHLHPTLAARTPQQQERHMLILECAQAFFARYGRQNITLAALAAALTISTGTLRRHFCDLDALFGEILRRHIETIAHALAEIPANAPNRPRALRQAYYAATRTDAGALTEAHALFTTQRNQLPPDLLEPLEQAHAKMGADMAGQLATQALGLLDAPWADLRAVETMLATLGAPRQPAQPIKLAKHQPPETLLPGRHPDDVFILPGGVTLDNKIASPQWQQTGQGAPPQRQAAAT